MAYRIAVPPRTEIKAVTYVRLDDKTIRKLDAMAEVDGSSRSTIIRMLVLKALRDIDNDTETKRAA